MARYRVLAWRDIPTQVQAWDETGTRINRPMPRWYMQEVGRITMREGLAGTDEYLEAFAWSADIERPGTADVVADAVMAELADRFGRSVDGRRLPAKRDEPGGPPDEAAGDPSLHRGDPIP